MSLVLLRFTTTAFSFAERPAEREMRTLTIPRRQCCRLVTAVFAVERCSEADAPVLGSPGALQW